MSSSRSIFYGMSIFNNNHWRKNQAVVVENNIITAIIDVNMIEHHLPAQQYRYSEDCYLVPGFIDMHIHGAGGADVMDADLEALQTISAKLAEEGVTGFLATTMTAAPEKIEAALAMILKSATQLRGAAILGIHLEGPFISSEKMGAQSGQYILAPDVALFNRWQNIAEGLIKLVTLAPEQENALNLVAALKDNSVIASIGHTNATYEKTLEAIAAGCTHATHLFNAMPTLKSRSPGPIGAILNSDAVTAELIADGHHLHPATCKLTLRNKGVSKLVLVSDAMRGKCMGNGDFELGGQQVTVAHGKATLKDGTLAGSVLSIPKAIKNMMTFTDCSLEEAITMATVNPAHQLKLHATKGSIEVGKHADLVVLDENLKVALTMREGGVIFAR